MNIYSYKQYLQYITARHTATLCDTLNLKATRYNNTLQLQAAARVHYTRHPKKPHQKL